MTLAPTNYAQLANFGKGDERKVQEYLLMLGAWLGGFGENTQRTYRTSVQQFFDLFDWICPEDVRPAHAVAFRKWLLERRKVKESTTYYRLAAISSFFDYLCKPAGASEEPLLKHNPFRSVPRRDIQPTPYGRVNVMDWKTFTKIVDGGIPSTPVGLRDKAILLFYAFTGRRRSEVSRLRIRDLDLTSTPRSYTVRMKGGEVRSFELPDICHDALSAYWMASDRLRDMRPDAGVFTADTSCRLTKHLDPYRPLSNRTMNEILDRAVVRAGLDPADETLCIHAIRHMSARDLNKAGARLQDIQAFLGHASPVTTQIYLGRISGPVPAFTESLKQVREYAVELAKGVSD